MIKNLLFDLGGVIMDIRRQNCIDAFSRLGMTDPGALLGEYQQSGIFGDLEAGRISADQFHQAVKEMLPAGVTDAQIDQAFNAFLTGIPADRLKALEHLHHIYHIYLISNTNPIMWNTEIKRQFEQDGHDISYYFDGIVTSFEAGVMKPDPAIFALLTGRFGIVPQQTLFFDDSQANLDAAARLGFRTVLVAPGQEFYKAVALGL